VKRTSQKKLQIVLTCLQPRVEISEVRRREGIHPAQHCQWEHRLLASAKQIFAEKPRKADGKLEEMEWELTRMKGWWPWSWRRTRTLAGGHEVLWVPWPNVW
jgi:transposase-like protein